MIIKKLRLQSKSPSLSIALEHIYFHSCQQRFVDSIVMFVEKLIDFRCKATKQS